MTSSSSKQVRILSIDPSAKGFGYVVFESPNRLVAWGLREARENKNARCLRQSAYLIKLYQPDWVALENVRAKGSRRTDRVRELIAATSELARKSGARVRAVSKAELRRAFESSGAKSKEAMARVLAERFPELSLRLPPARKPWNGPDPRMAIFMAMAMAMAIAALEER